METEQAMAKTPTKVPGDFSPFATINVLTDGDASVAKVVLNLGNFTMTGVGSAKKHPRDRVNEAIGTDLALGRAFEHVSRQLLRTAEMAVRQEEKRKRNPFQYAVDQMLSDLYRPRNAAPYPASFVVAPFATGGNT